MLMKLTPAYVKAIRKTLVKFTRGEAATTAAAAAESGH